MTPSQARNAIKKSLKVVIDPKPTKKEKEQVWLYFENKCAFCECELDPKRRQAHLDHVIADSEGGSNRLCNLILTCAICNGDEKREIPWQEFLQIKCNGETPEYFERHQRITKWFELQDGEATISDEQKEMINDAFDKVNAIYSEVVKQLRTQQN